MGRIDLVNGDVTNVECDVILHQVNCKGVMGSGVAMAIRQKYPEVYHAYVNLTGSHLGKTELLLGAVQTVNTYDGKVVANLFSQNNYGYGQLHTNYEAMKTGLTKLNDIAKGKTIALPYKMGSDRGGGSWDIVYSIIVSTLVDCDIKIVKL